MDGMYSCPRLTTPYVSNLWHWGLKILFDMIKILRVRFFLLSGIPNYSCLVVTEYFLFTSFRQPALLKIKCNCILLNALLVLLLNSHRFYVSSLMCGAHLAYICRFQQRGEQAVCERMLDRTFSWQRDTRTGGNLQDL